MSKLDLTAVRADHDELVTAKVGIGGVTDALLIMPPISIDASGGQVVIDSVFVISGTETIQGNVSAASSITYSIHGIDQV